MGWDGGRDGPGRWRLRRRFDRPRRSWGCGGDWPALVLAAAKADGREALEQRHALLFVVHLRHLARHSARRCARISRSAPASAIPPPRASAPAASPTVPLAAEGRRRPSGGSSTSGMPASAAPRRPSPAWAGSAQHHLVANDAAEPGASILGARRRGPPSRGRGRHRAPEPARPAGRSPARRERKVARIDALRNPGPRFGAQTFRHLRRSSVPWPRFRPIRAMQAWSMPVATTETRMTPSRLSSKVAPRMMLASWSTSSRMLLLARRLGVEVDDDDMRLTASLLDQAIGSEERRLERVEREHAEQTDHRDAVVDRQAGSRCVRGHVRGAEHPVGSAQIGREARLPPSPVAERDHVRAGRKQPVGQLCRDPASGCRVLTVDDAEVGLEFLPERRQPRLDRPSSRCAEHVGDEEDAQ